MKIPVDRILPNPEQPRLNFKSQSIRSLADSMRENGLVLPVAVEEAEDLYILHDGERRLRAAKLLGWEEIEATISQPLNGRGKKGRLARALVANLQRADLNPIEEAKGFHQLLMSGMSMLAIAQRLGLSINKISHRLKLLELDEPIQDLIAEGRLYRDVKLTEALLKITDADVRVKTAEHLAERGVKLQYAIQACHRIGERIVEKPVSISSVPAIYLSRRGPLPPMKWDALPQLGQVPPWITVEEMTRETCQNCSLRDAASKEICVACPLTDMLRRLLEIVDGH